MFGSKQFRANSVSPMYVFMGVAYADPCFCLRNHLRGGAKGGTCWLSGPRCPLPSPLTHIQTPTVSPSALLGEWLLYPLSFMPVRGAVMQTVIWTHTNSQSLTHLCIGSELAKVSSKTQGTPRAFPLLHRVAESFVFFHPWAHRSCPVLFCTVQKSVHQSTAEWTKLRGT